MNGFKIPRRGVQVTVLLEGNQEHVGQLYVPATGPYGGPGRLADRLNDDGESFIPLNNESGTLLLCKSRIVAVEVSNDQEEPEPMNGSASRDLEVVVETISGRMLSGRISYMMPVGQRRTLDFLNAAPAFIPLLGDGKTTHIRRDSVTLVREKSRESSSE